MKKEFFAGLVVGLVAFVFVAAGTAFAVSTVNFTSGVWNSSGNIGVGTTTPGYRLDVQGAVGGILGRFSAGGNKQIFAAMGTTRMGIQFFNSTVAGMGIGSDGNDLFIGRASATNNPDTWGSDWLIVQQGGNVGVGTTPGYKLDVAGTGNFTGVVNVGTPTAATNATTKAYVDSAVGGATGPFTISGSNVYVTTTTYNVGIGMTSPSQKLEVAGNVSSTGVCISGVCNSTWPSTSQWTTNGTMLYYNTGNVGIGITAPGAKLDVAGEVVSDVVGSSGGNIRMISGQYGSFFRNDGASTILLLTNSGNQYGTWNALRPFTVNNATGDVSFGSTVITQSNGNLSVGSGAGKVSAGTFDPPYTIDGAKYATYNPGMTGIKEETAGTVELQKGLDGKYSYVIDFTNQPTGSDLWLFGKVTGITKNFGALAPSLTAGFDGSVWYEKVSSRNILVIHATPTDSTRPTIEVSYRLTAPRFDAASHPWLNTRTGANEPDGIIVE